MRIYPTNKILYNQIDELWSIDLADMIEHEVSNDKGFGYILIIIDNFSKYTWAVPLKKTAETVTNQFPKTQTISKRRPLKLESDRGKEWYFFIFQNFLNSKNL